MSDIIEIVIRCFVAFALFILITKIIGKDLIGQMTYYHFIAAVTLGSIAGNMVFNIKIKFLYFLISMVLFGSITIVLTFLTLKSGKLGKWFSGEPTTIIKDGILLEENMKKIKYSLSALTSGLRQKEIFNLEEVEQAVLETNGTLSVLKKKPYRTITQKDYFDLLAKPPSMHTSTIHNGAEDHAPHDFLS
ncbi:DUF421 domain-containing protein [Aneurinibacillus sp. Ricciae_BoGa-3]|uniref:DUF421 domain-containing protein n=1 Tax=Aneurinibacillus sp. Ricciae_BoGa-3 TaxID=3022697 RepID=UPI0023412278|nr:DUF421 domain-containing protein [Aneurinibacillus sp. Ricciae_BoGa-3]WCK55467.1 DUF421 domain-containing protein [Aneurinibacillus sp. Ricciae_BoGa-3]